MKELISGVGVKKLTVIPDERGRLMEILRCDDKIFKKFKVIKNGKNWSPGFC